MVTGIIAIMAAASLPGSYDCTIEHQVLVTESGASDSPVDFVGTDPDAWRFAVRVPRGGAPRVTVEWPGDPIQIAGTHPTLPIAPGQLTFLAMGRGPCMFTEQACASLVSLSARDDGSAAFSILPAGSVRDQASDSRSLFHVLFVGTCSRRSQAR